MSDPAEQADAIQVRARSRIGQVLSEKWRLEMLLGVGGMAAVYAATHINNGRRAAIKLLHSELGANSEVRTRFLREGYVANKVDHPGTVSILDDQVGADGSVFLVMELLDGETLEDRRERSGMLPAHEVVSLADRLLDVLASAHAKGIVHRDIKPENIFLTREGQVKVLDFGIARMRELQSTRLTLTTAGAIGTPAFMPPEQARGRWDDVGPRSDIWAVGATMFTLVSGRLVHEAETVNELMLAAMTKQAPPVASIVPSVPAAVAAVIDRALTYDQNARWADARTMQAALRAAYQSFDRASITGQHAAHPGVAAVMGALPAAFAQAPPSVQLPMSAQPPMSAQTPMIASIPMGAPTPMGGPSPLPGYAGHVGGPGGATGHPVTMVGGTTRVMAQRGGVPLVPVVSGLLGAIVLGMILLGTWVTLHKPNPQGSGSATVDSTLPPVSASAGAGDPPAVGADGGAPQTSGAGEAPASSGGTAPGASGSAAPYAPPKRPAWIHKKHP